METGKWTPLKQILEESYSFLHAVIPAIGTYYDKSLLPAYDGFGAYGYRDRGYAQAKQLFELLSVIPDEEVKEPKDKADGEFSGYFTGLQNLASSAREFIPAMDKELEIIRKLNDTYVEPTRELIYKTVPERFEKYEGRLFFFPEEFVEFANSIRALRAYFDYRDGMNYLRLGYFADKIPVKELVKPFVPSFDAFGHKWNDHWELGSGDTAIDRFGLITLCVVDSEDNSTIARSLESGEPDEVLLNYVPQKGIDRVILTPKKELKDEMREDLRASRQRDTMCTSKMIRRSGNLGNYLKYLKRIKKDIRIEEEKRLGVV